MKYHVIELFCGCGGLSSGFKSGVFDFKLGFDLDKASVKTANLNSIGSAQVGRNPLYHVEDVRNLSSGDISAKLERPILIGGPPCQAYSMVGRGKLASLGHSRHHLLDDRGELYKDFVRIGLDLDSEYIVMENVVEITNYGGMNIMDDICEKLSDAGYSCGWTILNAANLGVPQTRERAFLIASKLEIDPSNLFPLYTHAPKSSAGASRTFDSKFHVKMRTMDNPKGWVTVEEAIGDLPTLMHNDMKYTGLKGNILKPYRTGPTNEYQALMRADSARSCTGHSFRRTERDFPIFKRMKQGDDYPAAHQIANELLEEHCQRTGIRDHSDPRYMTAKKRFVPPYDVSKFITKWKKLNLDRPSHTLVAHLGVDTYSHIHPVEPRGISVREAARLQSFRDDFEFGSNMSDAFRQIGNSVAPGVSEAIGRRLNEIIQQKN